MIPADPMDWTWTNNPTAPAATGDAAALRYRYGFRHGWVHLLLLVLGG